LGYRAEDSSEVTFAPHRPPLPQDEG
jgi:hypothetical protein